MVTVLEVAAVCVALSACAIGWLEARAWWASVLVRELAGHRAIRTRIAGLVGRRDQWEMGTVERAERLPGWVWVWAQRRPRVPYREELGWAPTRRQARRRLRATAAAAAAADTTPRR